MLRSRAGQCSLTMCSRHFCRRSDRRACLSTACIRVVTTARRRLVGDPGRGGKAWRAKGGNSARGDGAFGLRSRCLLVLRCLYGFKYSPFALFECLREHLLNDQSFVQSRTDKCLFVQYKPGSKSRIWRGRLGCQRRRVVELRARATTTVFLTRIQLCSRMCK